MLAFQRGSEEAFDSIVRHYHDGVRKFIGRYLADKNRAEDLAQEAFLRVYKARKRYEPTAKFHTWLFTIVTRLSLNEIRSRQRERKAIVVQQSTTAQRDTGTDDPVETVSDTKSASPLALLEHEELEGILQAAIQSLPGNQRTAILMLRFEDSSYQEIASVLNVSVLAVKSLVNRARETLKTHLNRYREGKALPRPVPGEGNPLP